ncbi:MAG: type II secretion system protein [Patescibacteria group bacterium]
MKKFTRGFTLIELLVVIAIIGILSSVVLVSLNSARAKGKDARIVSDVQQVRTALESGYNGTGYSDIIGNAANGTNILATITGSSASANALTQLVADAASQGGALTIRVNSGTANVVSSVYAIYGQLASDNTKYFCIDSTGKTNQAATNAVNANCQ